MKTNTKRHDSSTLDHHAYRASGTGLAIRSLAGVVLAPAAIALVAAPALAAPSDFKGAGLSAGDIATLKEQAAQEKWTFEVSGNPATQYDLAELTGLVVPDNWRRDAPFENAPPRFGDPLPSAFDWRNLDGQNYCTPVRNQAGCGSCWAFAVMGSVESGLKIRDGLSRDLSEQWLVSCCGLGGCSGEWPGNAANFLLESGTYTDECGSYGAVMETGFPYQASDAGCACPYDHPYTIENWAFIGPQWGTPSREQLKQSILDHGPITVCVTVNGAFQSYSGGIFNAHSGSSVNHAVVLVGWDDSQGDDGVWIMRNSWGSGWGESGYMRIAYECSRIGYNALFVDVSDTTEGVCCLNGFCVIGPQATCDSVGGTFLGAGSSCEDSACSEPCTGDVTGDGAVDSNDILALLAAWQCSTCDAEDVDGNGVVDTNDLLQMLGAWGVCG